MQNCFEGIVFYKVLDWGWGEGTCGANSISGIVQGVAK
jgi:hypothetical protein